MALPDRAPPDAAGGAPDPLPAGMHAAFDRVPPWTLTISAAMSIQFGAALAATLFDDVGASGATLLRLGFAALVLLVLVRPDPREYTRAELRVAFWLGLTLGLMNLLFYLALDRIPLGIAVTIEFAGPLGVAVFASRGRIELAWAALAAFGIVLLADPGGGGLDPLGLVLILGAAACWAAYILLAQRSGTIFRGVHGLALASVVTAFVPLVPGVVGGGSALLEPSHLLLGLGVALASSVIPYSLEVEALRRIPANVFGVLMSLEPAVAALAGWLVLSQALGVRDLVAMACVIAASIGVTLRARTWSP